MQERRNVTTRRRSLQRALTALLTANAEAQNAENGEAIGRIIKRLAVKGLARLTQGRWAPAPPLLMPATLVALGALDDELCEVAVQRR